MSQDYPEVNISTNPLNMPVFPAVIALGANIASPSGPPDATLLRAFDALPGSGVRLIARSSLWRTPCMPRGAGPDYVNAAAILETSLSPQALLDHLHAIEASFDRARTGRWAARTLDLDLIDFDGRIEPDANVQATWRALPPDRQAQDAPDRMILPHPRLQDRGFVLLPMQEIAPDWRDPVSGLDVTALIDRLPSEAKADIYPVSDTGELLSKSAGLWR